VNRQRKLLIVVPLVLLALAIVAIKPARGALGRFVSRIVPALSENGERPIPTSGSSENLTATPMLDVEQRARAAHGWSSTVVNSVARGAIIYYDQNGVATEQAALTVYRSYPDRVRVELYRRSGSEVLGFDSLGAWKSGVTILSAEQARDIRAYIRYAPERLFVTRDAGAAYREAGRRIEDNSAASPNQLTFDQVEMLDTIGPAPLPGRVGDRRLVYYYVNQTDSLVGTARWLEPDNPRQLIDDQNVAFIDVRADFSRWTRVAGVLWPFEVTHWQGGRVDYRVVIRQVLVNQSLADSIFQRP
jgi:hypothetical protein